MHKNIALVGNPNSGKSSLFNALTGLNQKVGNFPGVTVDKKTGRFTLANKQIVNLIDLPGTYSLYPKSDDEIVACDVLFDEDEAVKVDAVVVVVDASNLKRNLLFCSQIFDIKKPTIVVLTMMDIAKQKGVQIDLQGLSRELGYPVVAVNPRKEKGVSALKKELEYIISDKYKVSPYDFVDLSDLMMGVEEIIHTRRPNFRGYAAAHLACSFEKLHYFSDQERKEISDELNEVGFSKTRLQAEETLRRYAKIKKIMDTSVLQTTPLMKELFSRKIDEYLLHPVYGNAILLLVLFLVFQVVYWIAQYPTDWIDGGFASLISWFNQSLPDHFLKDLFINGILSGINGIVVFIPQIMLLFGIITILEDSGYMSRISFLMDRLMRSVGLNGKSVMPLVSGVACAVPAIMAARTIENKKEKLITILITPFMSCSARLPVYTILISLVIPEQSVLGIISLQGLVLFGMYMAGFLMSLVAAKVLDIFIKVKDRNIFLMELPVYRMPRWKNCFQTMIQKARIFLLEAGKVIMIISLILWVLSSYGPSQSGFFSAPQKVELESSYAGLVGKSIEPAIKPLGFDWKIGIALITSFAAREVFVGTMATLYSVNAEDEATLKDKMKSAVRPDGTKTFTLPVGLSLMIFYAFAMQCMSTMAIVKRETGTWRYPILQFIFMGILAYTMSLLVYNML